MLKLLTAPGARLRARRGTARSPGSSLHTLPIGLDFSGVSVAEGVRAALASTVFILLNMALHSEPLLIAATGAMITCFCDVGGTLRQRLPMLLSFTVLGALTWMCFGLLRGVGTGVVIAASVPAVFLLSMARVWGLRAQTVGNVLIVVLALAIDAPLTLRAGIVLFACFVAGGLWACVLTLLIWRIQPDRPVTRAVELLFEALADLTGDLRTLVLRDAVPIDWDAHARAHRRAVRSQIEAARSLAESSVGARGLVSGGTQKAAMLLEAADQLFGELIILSEMLESTSDEGVRTSAARLLRRVRPILRVLSTGRERDLGRVIDSLDRALPDAAGGDLHELANLIIDRLRVLVRLQDGQELPSLRTTIAPPDSPLWQARLWGPLRDELTWRSAILRHATRATLLTVPAVAITLVWWTPYAHWLTITVALTMQPFFAATWQRALERIGGTVLGALIGGALAFLPPSPIALGGALLPLSVIGFSVRQVSYGAYIACLTPLIVLLFDIVAPGHSPLVVAGMRTLYTLVGGVIAVTACMLMWPSWEPDRLRVELRGTLLAYARLAAAILGDPATDRDAGTEAARRAAGVANSNLEASLSRALQEPGQRHRAELLRLIAADAILRRLGAMLLAVPHDGSVRTILAGPARLAWQRYIETALGALAEGRPVPADVPAAPVSSTLQRIRRGLDVLAQDLGGAGAPSGVTRPSR